MRKLFAILGFVALLAGMSSARASCFLPVILANGTLADANQVMANFNALVACVNGTFQGPVSSKVGDVAVFNNTTGNLLADGGAQLGTNVTALGADPTGVNDSTTAIRNAITQALTTAQPSIFFPSGTYRFTDTITPGGSISVVCQGNNSTSLIFDDASGVKDGIKVGDFSFNFRGCNYVRKQAGTSGALIHLTDSNWVSIDHNRFDVNSDTCAHSPCPLNWDVIFIDSAVVAPFEIAIHDNYYGNPIHDFVFSNSQHVLLPMYDLHIYHNYGFSNGNAHYEMQGYGQFDLHDNAMCCGTLYDVYMNMASPINTSVNALSRFAGNDFDTVRGGGTSVYIAHSNGMHFENNNVGAVTLLDDPGTMFNNNQAICGGSCPWLIQGMVGGQFNNNRIHGSNNPITIQPNGAQQSQSLSFQNNEWLFSTGSFLTFNGGTPAADDIRVDGTHMAGNNEILATFTNAPTNWRATGDTSSQGVAVTFNTCTGVGATGTCNTFSPVGTMEAGAIVINTAGGGEAATGIIKMTYPGPLGPNGSVCNLTPQNGSGIWQDAMTLYQDGTTATSMQLHWSNNGVALTDAKQYNIEFACRGY